MNKIKRIHLSQLVILLMMSIVLGVWSMGSIQAQPVFRIGVIAQENSPLANGVRLAINNLNAMGGIQTANGTSFYLETVVHSVETAGNMANVVSQFQLSQVIAVIGPINNDDVFNNLNLLQSLNVPILTPATSDTILTSDATGRIIRVRAADMTQGQALANFLIREFAITDIATIQLDAGSTSNVIGFSTAASTLGVTPQPALLMRQASELPNIVDRLTTTNNEVVAAFGDPINAANLYTQLKAHNWDGIFIYPNADDPAFRAGVPDHLLEGILYSSSWVFTADDSVSNEFLNQYVREYASIPNSLAAAGFDAVRLLASALPHQGELLHNLITRDYVVGVQGLLRPEQFGNGETSSNVIIARMNPFGSPEVLVRIGEGTIQPTPQPIPTRIFTIVPLTATPSPTSTPEGTTITVRSEFQNVRSGPGMQYDILGQLNVNEQAQVIGANIDYSWVVIAFRGQQGWLASYLVEVFGDLRTVPIVPPPPTPTPNYTATPTPQPEPDLVIEGAAVLPSTIIPQQPFTLSVTVRNNGGSRAPAFTIGAQLAPDNLRVESIIPVLDAGQSAVVQMTGTLNFTGRYNAALTVDPNNQVFEGVNGELNNTFSFSYVIDRPTLTTSQRVLNIGETADLEGNLIQGDLNWNNATGVTQLEAIFGAQIGIMPASDFYNVHYDLINVGIINRPAIPISELQPNMTLGIFTADGNRGVIRIDSVTHEQIIFTYRIYQG